MPKLNLLVRNATALNEDGSINEEAYRQFLQRFVDARIGVYLGSAGSAEGGAMTADELRRIYRVGVDVCKGKVQVNGNPPEKPTVRETLEHIRLAIEGGVEIVNVYGPPGWHAFRPTDEEYAGFFDELLQEVKHPVAIAPNRIHSTCRKVSPQSDLPGESPDRITDAHNIRRRLSHVRVQRNCHYR